MISIHSDAVYIGPILDVGRTLIKVSLLVVKIGKLCQIEPSGMSGEVVSIE